MGLLDFLDIMQGLGTTGDGLVPSAAAVARLPSYPLAVKSPYLSTWVAGNQLLSSAPTAQPTFWNGINVTWPVLARVNGDTYALFGHTSGALNATTATTNSVSYTSSHTYVSLTAGSANFILDFFSPVLPGRDEYARQSLPYSYLTVSVSSSQDNPPAVQVMSAIDYTWTAQGGAASLNYTQTKSSGYFQFYNSNETLFEEVSDMARWGSVLFAAGKNKNVTQRCGTAADILSSFAAQGSFGNETLAASCNNTDYAAISEDLGVCGPIASNARFIVGFDRVDAIQYLNESQTGFYRTQWPTIPSAIDYMVKEYTSFFSSSLALDAAVRTKAEQVSSTFGSKYADIVEASVRQTFGGMELTVPANNLSYYPPDAFLKEISSDGNVNTVDFIFQSWPIFVNLNPEYIKLLFEPILSYLDAGRFPHKYVIHDIGTHYPNATGHDDGVEEHMPVFETSATFILLYAYQELTGDESYAETYRSMLERYADWLAERRSLYPARQLISVDAIRGTANQTGLAVQAAIGLKAASALLRDDSYAKVAESNVNAIYYGGLGLDGSSPTDSEHFTYNYDFNETWNVLFPSYCDVFLDLDTFPASAWEMQSDWYLKMMKDGGLAWGQWKGGKLNWGLTDWSK
jgi:hypothetical protein